MNGYVIIEIAVDPRQDPLQMISRQLAGLVEIDPAFDPVRVPAADEDRGRIMPEECVMLVRARLLTDARTEDVELAGEVLRVWADPSEAGD